ncbi:MAG TPA: class I SAM-dependent methyltransferase [Gemmatirosa sp.]
MTSTAQVPEHDQAIAREREYWTAHDEFDWMTDGSKVELVTALEPARGDVLELCIGSGLVSDHVPPTYRTYTGLDISQPLLDAAQRKVPNATMVQGDAEQPPFPDASFDTVLVFAGLHHLPDYRRSITNAFRVLRPGGEFACFEPNKRAWYRTPIWLLRDVIGIYTDDEVFLDPRQVAAAMRDAGFSDLRTRYMTPRLKRSFLTAPNRVLARCMYAAAALGRAAHTQSFFLLSGRKPPREGRGTM